MFPNSQMYDITAASLHVHFPFECKFTVVTNTTLQTKWRVGQQTTTEGNVVVESRDRTEGSVKVREDRG